MKTLAFAFAACAAVPGFAACPVPGDMAAAGVVVTLDNGSVTTYARAEDPLVPGEILETSVFEDGWQFIARAYGGVMLVEGYDVDPNGAVSENSRTITRYSGVEAVFPVEPGQRDFMEATELSPSSGKEAPLRSFVTSGAPHVFDYAGCPVTGIPLRVTHEYLDAEGKFAQSIEIEFLDYLPDYGIAVYLGGGSLGQDLEFYTITGFKAGG